MALTKQLIAGIVIGLLIGGAIGFGAMLGQVTTRDTEIARSQGAGDSSRDGRQQPPS